MSFDDPFTSGAVSSSKDLERILALPRRASTEAEQDALVHELTPILHRPQGSCPGCKHCEFTGSMRLRRLQALALYELGTHGGGFFPKGVGEGKSLTSFLAPFVLDAKKPMLVIPAGLIGKTKKDRLEVYGPHWHLVPLYTMSFEKLGRADYAGELEQYAPDLIIIDEVHKLKNAEAAVTKRFLRYLEAHSETMVVALSGTIMNHSILEFAHIVRWCLKGRSPVPLSDSELQEWAAALDVKPPRGNEFARSAVGELVRLADGYPELEAIKDRTERARKAFRQRLVSTPGIVASFQGGEAVNASIRVRGLVYAPTTENADDTQEHFYRLRKEKKLTNDWDLATPMEVWAHAREIALGLSYTWEPKPPVEWREPRKAWFKFIRSALKASSKNGGELDSPFQVEAAVRAGYLPGGLALLEAWLAAKAKYPPPNTVPVWHDDLALNACAKWAKSNGPGIIWTEHTLFALRLAKHTGLKYYGQRGLTAAGEFIDDADPRKSVIASVDANKEGRNLQKLWSRNLITALEGLPSKNQQLIGRTHRSGQDADEVFVDILIGCYEHLRAWDQLHEAARAVRDTTGEQQKILIANIEDWPDSLEVARWTGARWVSSSSDDDDYEEFDPVKAREREREQEDYKEYEAEYEMATT